MIMLAERSLKKYFTILSSKEWNVTTTKTPPFVKTVAAFISPKINSLISLFTNILSAWKTLVALWILKFSWFKKAFISAPMISLFFSSIYIWEKLYEVSLESTILILPVDLKTLFLVEYSKFYK